MALNNIDYSKICFVIMPFGSKAIDGQIIDFDRIYKEVFEPAINAVLLEEGGSLTARRADDDYFASTIDMEMYMYLEYARFALVDITGLNPNVFYELGIRHRARQNGTAIFRQSDKIIPFDISHIKAFPYEFQPVEKVNESKILISKVLSESLKHNKVDNFIHMALNVQRSIGLPIDQLLIDATNAIRNGDFLTATKKYQRAIEIDNSNPLNYQELGLLLRKQERWPEAIKAFENAKNLVPKYGEAWRELGVAQNKVYHLNGKMTGVATGEESLLKAIEIDENDFDALASLGGIYKRMNRWDEASKYYNRSVMVSNGHPYPLLNSMILKVKSKGVSAITELDIVNLKRAEIPLRNQIKDMPPYNSPWSFFDLSTIIMLTEGDLKEATSILREGIVRSNPSEVKTHLDTLTLIENSQNEVKGLSEQLTLLKKLS